MSVPEWPSAYRLSWRASKYGHITHAVISDLHPLVRASWIADPDGGPYTEEDLDRHLRPHVPVVRPERRSDRRCEQCTWLVAEADSQVKRAAWLWAVDQLGGVLAELAQSAPIGSPLHER